MNRLLSTRREKRAGIHGTLLCALLSWYVCIGGIFLSIVFQYSYSYYTRPSTATYSRSSLRGTRARSPDSTIAVPTSRR